MNVLLENKVKTCTFYCFGHFDVTIRFTAIERYYVKRAELDPNQEFEIHFNVDDASHESSTGVADGEFELVKTKTGEKTAQGK